MQKFQYFLQTLKTNKALNAHDSYSAFSLIADNAATNDEIKDFLLTINLVGINEDLLFGAAKSLNERSIRFRSPPNAIDVCGTGGDNSNSLNISTTVAILLASMGIPVAKHGNRAVSSKSGSADIFAALGIDFNKNQDDLEMMLSNNNLAFIFAPFYHPALQNVAQARRELGVRTIFNFLGPLLNPAQTKYQLIGCSDRKMAKIIIKTCKLLGKEKAVVVTGLDGMDEISLTRNSIIYKFDKNSGKFSQEIFNPQDYGIQKRSGRLIEGGDAKYNAAMLVKLLRGDFTEDVSNKKLQAYFDIVCLNGAAALMVADKAENFADGITIMQNYIKSGKALQFLKKYRSI